MKRNSILRFGLLQILNGCSSTKVVTDATPTFLGANVEERGSLKKLILRFTPETPHYEVVHNRENTLSEVRWKSAAPASYNKEFQFTERTRGVRKALVIVDAKTQTGTMTLWHDATDSFSFSRQSVTELALLPDDPYRKTASLKNAPGPKRITLNVKGAPLDRVIRSLAAESQKSLVLSSDIKGTVTVALDNVPYEQAIDLILRPTEYRADHTGDVTVVRSAKDARTYRAFKLRYVDVNDVKKSIQEIAGKDAQLTVDSNSNSLFIIDRFESLKNVELMLGTLDVEPRQVEVESAILEVDKTDLQEFGIDFSSTVHSGSTPSGMVSNSIGTANLSPISSPSIDAQAKGFFVGLSWQSVSAILSAVNSKTTTHLLARPRVLALTDQEASVVLGSKLGYKTVTVTTTGTVENINFLTVGTQLKIKPHITMNNDVLMTLKPEVSDGAIDATTGVPSENTTTTETKILAKNGQTVIIAGLIKDRVSRSTDRIPILGDIPLLGALFGGTTNEVDKNEIVILLTPRVLTNEMLLLEEQHGNDAIGRFYEDNSITGPGPAGLAPRE